MSLQVGLLDRRLSYYWFPVGAILKMIILNPYKGVSMTKRKIVSNKDPD